jgi:predicted RNA binding protein YcfA (HicA-like mRNA interferase family)
MSRWPAVKSKTVLAALLRIGWSIKRHKIGPRMLARIAKHTGLKPEDL